MIRLIDRLREQGISSREAHGLLITGKVLLKGVPTADAGRLVDSNEVRINLRAPRLKVGRDLVILERDPHLAVVWKPPGMLSVAAPRRRDANLVSEVARLLGGAYPVHRLDEETSGLMIVACTAAARSALIPLFAQHAIQRSYLALVAGVFPPAPLTVCNTLVQDRGDGRRGAGSGPEAVEAVTHFRRLQVLQGRASLVEARLETGRTHQVRIHLSEAGFPILGDPRYGGEASARQSRRLALHSYQLAFAHPFTRARIKWEAPLADDLEQLRRKLSGEERSL